MVCRKLSPNMPFSDRYYFEDSSAKKNADRCWELLYRLNNRADYGEEFGVFETRQHNMDYVCCWYAGYRRIDEEEVTLVLHFNIMDESKKEGIRIFFRLHNYAPKNRLKNPKKESEKWVSIPYSDYTENELVEILNEYLRRLKANWEDAEESLTKRKQCKDQRNKV
jgi:hypothetical protein